MRTTPCRIVGDADRIEESILEAIRPSKTQIALLSKFYSLLKSRLESCLTAEGHRVRVELVGSFAKGTLLSDKWEIDVFTIFEDRSKDWIKTHAENVLRKCLDSFLPAIAKYAEHPYLTVSLMGLEADIVPIADPRSISTLSGVERTPLHTRWVNKHLSRKQRDEVRLLKSFLKGIGIYGAETRTHGFSGYSAELLIYVYGSFRSAIRAISEWKPPIYVDPSGRGDPKRLRRKYRDSTLILVDPVDPERNVAGSVSLRSLSSLILASKLYLGSPSSHFFHACIGECEPPKPRVKPYLLIIECEGAFHKKPPETIWGKLLRSAEALSRYLEGEGVPTIDFYIDTNEYSTALIGVSIMEERKRAWQPMPGPPVWSGERSLRFIMKRLSEGGHVTIGDNGYLDGLRPQEPLTIIELALKWISSPSNRISRDLGGKCVPRLIDCGRGWSAWCDPTPKWIRCLSTLQSRLP